MFSCLGPDSFVELRPLYARNGWGRPAPDWWDMHDIGDLVLKAGLADPVMDQQRLRLTWASPERLLADLQGLLFLLRQIEAWERAMVGLEYGGFAAAMRRARLQVEHQLWGRGQATSLH